LLFDAIFHDALEADAERLDRLNLLLAALPPNAPAPDGLRPVELLLLHPTRDLADLAAGQGRLLPPGVRRIVRALAGSGTQPLSSSASSCFIRSTRRGWSRRDTTMSARSGPRSSDFSRSWSGLETARVENAFCAD